MAGQLIIYRNSDVLTVHTGIIAHVANDLGLMSAGIALQIRNKWPQAYTDYTAFHHSHKELLSGRVVFTTITPRLLIAHCIAQHGLKRNFGSPPFRAGWFQLCLNELCLEAKERDLPIRMPYGIGCGLAGGSWSLVKGQIERVCCQQYELDVHIHKLSRRM